MREGEGGRVSGCGEDGPGVRRVALDHMLHMHDPVSMCVRERDCAREMGVCGYGT